MKLSFLVLFGASFLVGCGDDTSSSTSSGGGGGGGGGTSSSSSSTSSSAGGGGAGGEGGAAAAVIVGDWVEPPPNSAIMRFRADGTQSVAFQAADLDTAPLASGTWAIDGDTLTLRNTAGACSSPEANQVGVYEIALSSTELTFTLVDDACPQRNVIDGETWTRLD